MKKLIERLSFLAHFTLIALCPVLSWAQQVNVTISNPTAAQRQELVSIPVGDLGFPVNDGVVVRDAFGIERTSQVTHERHQSQIYVALAFPYQQVVITTMENHGVGILRGCQSGQHFRYFFGAAWSEFDVHSQDEWQLRVNSLLNTCQYPLTVHIQK